MASFPGLDPYALTNVTAIDKDEQSGAYATVVHLNYLGLKCAGKRIHVGLLGQGEEGGDITTRFKQECDILSKIRHPNIVQFYGVFYKGETTPLIVTEYFPTTLTSCIESYGIFPKEFSYSILHDVALGLSYLHDQTPPIVHGDFSSNSVVLTSTLTAKIADVGVTRIASSTKGSHMTKLSAGTLAFTPPEVVIGESKIDTSANTFSLGIMMIHVFSGRWPEPQAVETSKKKSRKSVPPTEAKRRETFLLAIGKDHPMMDLICKCIENDPQKRATATEILQQLTEMVSKFPSPVPDPLNMMKILMGEGEAAKALNQVADEKEKTIHKMEEQHRLEVKQLEEYLENLRVPLSTTKQPLQANITWKQSKHPPPAVPPVQSTVINGKVYLGGGESEYVYCFNPSEEKWNNLPPLPVKEYGLGQINGTLVAVGGVDYSTQLPSNILYSLSGGKSQKWERKFPPMLTARHSVAVTGLKSALLVAGGLVDTHKSTHTVEVFKSDTARWYKTDSFQLPTACFCPSLTVMEDMIYVIGGYHTSDQTTTRLSQAVFASVSDILDVAEYDEVNGDIDNQWKKLHGTPTFQPLAVMLDGNLLAVCGHDTANTSTRRKQVYMYSQPINSWIYISDLPESIECTTTAALSPTEILVVGSDAEKVTTIFMGSVTAEMNIQV